MAMIIAPARSRLAHGTTLILLTMSLSVLIAQIDTSVVNLAVKEIGARLGAGVTALQCGGRRLQSSSNARLLLTAGTFADLYGRRASSRSASRRSRSARRSVPLRMLRIACARKLGDGARHDLRSATLSTPLYPDGRPALTNAARLGRCAATVRTAIG